MEAPKRKMQSVNFRNFIEMLDYLPEDQLAITERLRELILESIPGVREKLSYNAPFYALHQNVCYIWPGAIPWGRKTSDGVTLGFSYGYLLNDVSNYLEPGDRKQVHTKTFYRLEDIEEDIVRHLLMESAEIDEMVYREKQQFRKKGR